MANLIVIRLHPAVPTSGSAFTKYLTGMTIKAFDLSFNNPSSGKLIGTATYLPPSDSKYKDPKKNQIVQHSTDPLNIAPDLAIATAVISAPGTAGEYVTGDLRLEITRAGGESVATNSLYYDVSYVDSTSISFPPPTPPPFGPIVYPASTSALVIQYLSATSFYVSLSAPADPNLSQVQMPSDGTPPNFADLQKAITTVLKADPGGATDIRKLVSDPALAANRCRHLASEIIFGRQDPLPPLDDTPPSSISFPVTVESALERMYTNPPNTAGTSNQLEQDRQQFEGDLSSYYATRNADVERLSKFIFALAAALVCEDTSKAATSAVVDFPVNPGGASVNATVIEAAVVFNAQGGFPLNFDVPAEYFYVLGARMPLQITPDQRYQIACRNDQQQTLAEFTAAVDSGIVNPLPATNPAQAARMLTALAVPAASAAPQVPLNASLQVLLKDWLGHPKTADWRSYQPYDDIAGFWPTEAAGHAGNFLDLVLAGLTQAYVDPDDNVPLGDKIKAGLTITSGPGAPKHPASVADLQQASASDWQTFFTLKNAPAVWPNNNLDPRLPPFTRPGNSDVRIIAFIRNLRKFFDVSSVPGAAGKLKPGTAPTFGPPVADLIQQVVSALGAGFAFGNGFNETQLETAVATAVNDDPCMIDWLMQIMHTIDALWKISALTPAQPDLSFSIAESLYARGFKSADDVKRLDPAAFQQALIGTIAWQHADDIYKNAQAATPPPGQGNGGFSPVNPDGSLTDCIPPCHLSPLGPVAYLNEMLKVTESLTCSNLFAPSATGQTLAAAIAGRRNFGDLAVTTANLETPVPLIGIVNECLENLATNSAANPVAYNTNTKVVAGHELCEQDCCCSKGGEEEQQSSCNTPARLFCALPEHSTPATPVALPGAYEKLKKDFSCCCLPYSQPLDISRSYLDAMGLCRFDLMRAFRKEITEFALDPSLAAPVFQSHLWRLPVRIELAIEYLGITPEEYSRLFGKDVVSTPELYGFDANAAGGQGWLQIVVKVPEFLKRTCLTYCEFVALQKALAGSQLVSFSNAFSDTPEFPDCEPCCFDQYGIGLNTPPDQQQGFRRLAIFIRLWHKLKHVCGAKYTFEQLRDICEVLQLFSGNVVNPDFIRQLAAFQILRDRFGLRLGVKADSKTNATGADRTRLLALRVGPGPAGWGWALEHLLEGLQHHAKAHAHCERRGPAFMKLLAENLDPLSRLAGFNPNLAGDTWHMRPTSTLRFAEVLAKIYASRFTVGEILFLFTAGSHLDGDDPFELQEENESLDSPLGLPDDEREHSLWALRRKLLAADVPEEEVREWSWPRIEASLRNDFGYAPASGAADPLTSLGEHFFPNVLESFGIPVDIKRRQYRVKLPATSAGMWNTPPDGPFHYDSVANELWVHVPLKDAEVIEKLGHLRQLNPQEEQAVQDLYFLPRVALAPFEFLFADFNAADRHLIQERDEAERWAWFQRQFALAHIRSRIIADHLACHVAHATGAEWHGGVAAAWLLLKHLFADENQATTPWEDDSGKVPSVTWQPQPNGGAFAALLGLTGTGLAGEYSSGGSAVWREVRGPMHAFGRDHNLFNSPVPTVLPDMNLPPAPELAGFATVRNGLALADKTG